VNFFAYLVARFPSNARMWEGIVSKGEYVTASIKSGIGPNEFLFMHGFVFWFRVGGGSRVTQVLLRVITCVQLVSPFVRVTFLQLLTTNWVYDLSLTSGYIWALLSGICSVMVK
jgi:hypothetical protein